MDRPYRIEIMPGVWLTAIQSRKFKSSYWSLRLLTPLTQETAAMNAAPPSRPSARHSQLSGSGTAGSDAG